MNPEPEEADRGYKDTRTPPPQILLPLEERATHFRDMLLERGVRTGPRRGSQTRGAEALAQPGGHFTAFLSSGEEAE